MQHENHTKSRRESTVLLCKIGKRRYDFLKQAVLKIDDVIKFSMLSKNCTGGLFNLRIPRGGLNKEGGLIGEGGLYQNQDQRYKNDFYFPVLVNENETKMYNKTVAEI